MGSAGKVAVDIVANTSTFKTGMAEARQAVGSFTASATAASKNASQMVSGFNMARSGAAQLAVQMLGTKSAAASLATGMAMSFGITAGPLLAVTAGVAAIAYAFDKMTGSARKAKQEMEDLGKRIVEQSRSPMQRAAEQYEALNALIAKSRQDLKDAESGPSLADFLAGAKPGGSITGTWQARVAKIKSDIADAVAALGKLDKDTNQALLTDEQKKGIAVANQRREAIKAMLKSLKEEGDVIGMSGAELQKYRLEVLGANKAEIAWAEARRRRNQAMKVLDKGEQGLIPRMQETQVRALEIRGDLVPVTAKDRPQSPATRAELTKPAEEWKQAWRDAIESSSQAFTTFFQQAFNEGQKLRDFLRGLLASFANVFASFAANKITGSAIKALHLEPTKDPIIPTITGLFAHTGGLVGAGGVSRQVPAWLFARAPRMHNGGLASDEVPAILQRGERVLSRAEVARGASSGPTVHVHQTINMPIHAMDGPSVQQVLDRHAGDIANIIARASREAPGYARSIVANGMRR